MTRSIKALILTADKFEDMELFYPYFRLLEEGVEVDIASPKKGRIEGERGYEIEVEKTFGARFAFSLRQRLPSVLPP